jgi:IS5 family transposase
VRKKWDEQLSIFHVMSKNKVARELGAISEIIEANPQIVELVYKEVAGQSRVDTGRSGMTAEQVLRCAVLKQYRDLTYEELAFHLEDSWSFRSFAKMRMGQKPGASTLQDNIAAVREQTWEAIHREIIGYAEGEGIEKGRTTRIDSTAVKTNIHAPSDCTLLQDGIRIITRWLTEGKRLSSKPGYLFCDHNRSAKKQVLAIQNAKKEKVRQKDYKELLRLAKCVKGYAASAIPVLYDFQSEDTGQKLAAYALAEKLDRALWILVRVMDQTQRRVLRGEKVSASEKVVSFFECHTDIIVKGNRETRYGHKVVLTGGRSGLIIDCLIERGNPNDAAQFEVMIERQEDIYGRPPRQVAADGGFASRDNLEWARQMGVKDVAFAKKRGLSVLDMVKSNWVYRKLRNFRAGIEANISWLKRSFGLDCCTWRGWAGFKRYLWSSIVSYNLLALGRRKLATA